MRLELRASSSATNAEPMKISSHDLVCLICKEIADDPYITSCCGQVFCQEDADTGKYINGCPHCRQETYTFKQSLKHKAMVDKLTVKCVCSERLCPQELENHKQRCPKVTVNCPHSTCQEKDHARTYSSAELVKHLASAHCDEVPILGDTFVNKKEIEPLKRASDKYSKLLKTLYSEIYPKMIEIRLKSSPELQQTSPIFQCSKKHPLSRTDGKNRKHKDGTEYTSPGFSCDVCNHTFLQGSSWHCSCTNYGYDKCAGCIVFELYQINNDVLRQAGEDHDEEEIVHRPTITRLPRSLLRLLTGSINNDDNDIELGLPDSISVAGHNDTFERMDDDET